MSFSGHTLRNLCALASLGLISPACQGPAQNLSSMPVWVLRSSERAGQTDRPGDRTSAELFAAQGEYESFQIVIQAPAGGLTNVNVSMSDLTDANGNVIGQSRFTLYREHYVRIDQSSPDRGGPNRPRSAGWFTDPLIPFIDPHSGKPPKSAIFTAAPFDVTPSRNQPIWIDVYVPPGTTPGEYTATATITSDEASVNVPVKLTVWNFSLPLKPSMKSVFLYWTSLDSNTVTELLKHKIMPQKLAGNSSSERSLIDTLGLTATTMGFWSGADVSNCWMRPAPSVEEFRHAASSHQRDLVLLNYTADEVDQCTNLYPAMQNWARNMHAAGVRNLVVMTPVSQLFDDGSGNGKPAVDVWVVLPSAYVKSSNMVAQARATGSEIWSYNALVQDGYSPKWLIDFDPIGMRLQAGFISQSLNLTGLLYWRIDRWGTDPWNNVNNQGVFNSSNYPGEGVLVYPGGPAGIAGAVPSIRLKQLRDGIEDYEFVEILKQRGRGDWAREQIQSVGRDWTNWTRDGNALESVRRQLGSEIQRLSAPPTQ
jgi:hypothetical protein